MTAIKLRKPCEHGFYDKHVTLFDPAVGPISRCDGGVFLPDDTLVVEKVDGEWPEWAKQAVRYEANGLAGQVERILDALSVREAE